MALRYLSQKVAQEIDVVLMSPAHGFSIDQLMELAGLSVAEAVFKIYGKDRKRPLIICGPGNNGGDGFVAARHLRHFGMEPRILYPKPSSKDLFQRLVKQCEQLEIPMMAECPESLNDQQCDLIVDGIFGFGFSGDVRPPFDTVLKVLRETDIPIVSIDVPSGWDVEKGDLSGRGIRPEMLVSLTAPKLCAAQFKGKYHFLGGRFIPSSLENQFQLNLPKYQGTEQSIQL